MSMSAEKLTPRRARILGAIVEEYVKTATPVGSKAVRERHGIEASTATIRNEMSVLERHGYIRQPHTSAGRVPADKGYRMYVDAIMAARSPRLQELSWVRAEYRRTGRDPERLYRTTSRVLSQLAGAPAMVMAPPEHPVVLAGMKLTPVSATVVRLEYTTEPGGRCECLLHCSESITAAQVEALGRALVERYAGRDVSAISLCPPDTIDEEMGTLTVPADLLAEIKGAVEADRMQRVYVDGAAYALDFPECQEIEHLRPLMTALDEERVVRRLLRPATRRSRLTVTIGREQEVRDLRRCSLVARHFQTAADEVGALGVIGPTRMDYRAVTGAVACVAERFPEALAGALREEAEQ